jgi:peptidoglycan hydrolase CwlO-like protein
MGNHRCPTKNKFLPVHVLLVTVFFLLLAFTAASGEEQGAGLLKEREAAYGQKSALEEREKQLLADLLDLDVKIESARINQSLLQGEIAEAGHLLEESRAALFLCRERRDENLVSLGQWVNFLYRYGAISYLEVLLQASDFYDFINRLERLKIIVSYQARLFLEAKSLLLQVQEMEQQFNHARIELNTKSQALSSAINEMERLRAGRQVVLEDARKESGTLSESIATAEIEWVRSLKILRYMVEHLDALPWSSLAPENVSLTLSGARLEFSDEQINKTFFAGGAGFAAGLSIESAPGLFTIKGRTSGAEEYSISGEFITSPDGSVRFQPRQLRLAGIPVSEPVLAFVTSARALSFDPSKLLSGFKLAGLKTARGKLIIALVRRLATG